MRRTLTLGLFAAVLIAGFASAGTYLSDPAPAAPVDFCFGYAICQ